MDYDWIRFNVGIGIRIEGTLTDVNDANHTYDIRYGDNPVGYVGIGFGSRPVEGVMWALTSVACTPGAAISSTGTTVNTDVLDEIPNTPGFGRVLPNLQLVDTDSDPSPSFHHCAPVRCFQRKGVMRTLFNRCLHQ